MNFYEQTKAPTKEIPKIGCVQHDCDACLARAKLNPREVYEANHAAREAIPKFEYIYNDAIYDGVFDIIKFANGDFLFAFLDKRNYYNIFETMQEYTNYTLDLDCKRVCFANKYIEEDEPGYEEGVDALERYLRTL